jgi:hypothetical protein
MLLVPRTGFLDTVPSTSTTSSAGVTVTASATAHTKGGWSQLVANTGARSLGILIALDNTAVANTATSMLLDIGIGGAGSEQVLIPDLAAGYVLGEAVSNTFCAYFFPLFIPAGSRLAARCQAQIASDTVACRIHLFQRPTGAGWVGTRVTAYGVDAANSRGTVVSAGNNSYGTAGQLAASTDNPIRMMQIGIQAAGRTALTDARLLADVRLGAATSIAGPLMGSADTGVESVLMSAGNQTLARMGFTLPEGQDLRVAAMHNTTAANYDFICYGVD